MDQPHRKPVGHSSWAGGADGCVSVNVMHGIYKELMTDITVSCSMCELITWDVTRCYMWLIETCREFQQSVVDDAIPVANKTRSLCSGRRRRWSIVISNSTCDTVCETIFFTLFNNWFFSEPPTFAEEQYKLWLRQYKLPLKELHWKKCCKENRQEIR